jgi:predicted Zn-dependent protease
VEMPVKAQLVLRRLATGLMAFCALGLPLQAMAQDGGLSLIRDTEVEFYLKDHAKPVLEASGLEAEKVHFILVADNDLNAFASSNLLLALNTGLIEAAATPNELMGVIAHEAGHLSGGHMVRTDEIYRAARLPTAIAMGLGIVAMMAGANNGGSQAGLGILASSSTFGTLGALHYMQSQESAADIAGVKSLEAAGLSGQGLVDFFARLRMYETFSDAERYKYFRTHPLSRERVQTLRTLVDKQPHHGVKDSPEDIEEFNLIKAKLSGFLDPYQTVFIKYPMKDTSFAARYARVIATYKTTDIPRALSLIDDLLKEQPDNPYLWELKGQIYFETGQAKLAKPAHERSVALMPQAPLLHVNLGQTLIATGDKADVPEAITQLQESLKYEADNSFVWSLLAQAYDAQGQAGMARLASAEAAYIGGDYQQARTFAVWSQKNLDPNSPEYRRARDIVIAASSQMGISPVEGETRSRRRP